MEGTAAGPVRDDEVLYRRVTPDQIKDGKITSGVFRTRHDDGCSTESASYVSQEDCLGRGRPGGGLVSITGADVTASGAQATRDPTDPGHVLITGPGKKFPKELAIRAKLLVVPSAPGGGD